MEATLRSYLPYEWGFYLESLSIHKWGQTPQINCPFTE